MMTMNKITDVKLIGAKDAAELLGVNKNKIYELWKSGKLTWWMVGGTKKTTREAIAEFLYNQQCVEAG